MNLFTAGILGLWLAAFAQPSLAGQQTPTASEQNLPLYEGQGVSSVELAGRPDVNEEELAPLLRQRAGQPFSRANVDATVAALKRTGKFRDVRLQVLPEVEGVRVLFVLEPAVYFGIYRFPGAVEKFSYSRLLQAANYPPEAGAFTRYEVQRAQAALEAFFKRDGFFQAQVRPEVKVDSVHGIANVIFRTSLNRRAQFGNVTIEGATPQETRHLQDVLRSLLARLRGSSIRPGKTYSLKTLQNATQYLQNALNKQGHLAAQVSLIRAAYDPATNRADIVLHTASGPLVHVEIEGAHLWSWTRRKLLPVYQQAGVDPELIQEGRQNLLSYLQSKGYFDAKVATSVQQGPAGETILYQVTKGPRHKVEEVSIAGSQHLSSDELMAHVTVQKARFPIISHGKYSDRLVRTSVRNLTNIYQAAGFSTVKITPQVSARGGNLVVTFRVDEGPQDIVESLRIEGNRTLAEANFAPKGLKIAPGKAYSQERVDQDRNQIVAQYLNRGYLTAAFRETAQPAGQDPHRIRVVYHISEGPQVRIASVITEGRRNTRQSVISRTADFGAGRPLREDQMLAAETRLYDLGVFDWAQVDPRRHITTQTREDVVVKVHEAKRNQIIYGGGFEVINRGGSVPSGTVAVPGLPPVGLPSSFKTSQKTFWGPRGSFEYTRKNLRGRAESITVGGLAGRLDQRGSFTYLNPHFHNTDWTSSLTLAGEHNSQNPIFTSRLGEVGVQLQRSLDPKKTQSVFLRYNFREIGLTRLLIPALVPPEDRQVRLSTFSGTYLRDTRDNPLNAHKGIYESFEFDISPGALGSSAGFAKLLGQTAYYKDVGAGIIWANSLRLGLEKPFAGSHVPLSEKFFSGGGSTLRGFPLNGAGPQRTIPACGNPSDPSTCSFIQVPVGGNELLILNSEFRFPLNAIKKGLGVVGFYDGGNVFPTIGFHGQYTNSVGAGLRYATPVGPIRIDIGHNLNAPPGIKSTQIFITLGQAF